MSNHSHLRVISSKSLYYHIPETKMLPSLFISYIVLPTFEPNEPIVSFINLTLKFPFFSPLMWCFVSCALTSSMGYLYHHSGKKKNFCNYPSYSRQYTYKRRQIIHKGRETFLNVGDLLKKVNEERQLTYKGR